MLAECRSLIESGALGQASAQLREFLRNHPDSPEATLLFAQLQGLLGHFSLAEENLLNSLRNSPTPEATFLLAALTLHKGEPHNALSLAETAAELSPADPDIQRLLGSLNQSLERHQQARLHLANAASLEPPEIQKGTAALIRGDLSTALIELEKAHSRTPFTAALASPYAATLHLLGNVEQACKYLRATILRNPTEELFFVQLGELLSQSNKLDDALHCLQAALNIFPKSPNIRLRIGALLLRTENPGPAVTVLQEAVNLKPDWPQPLGILAAAHLQIGNHQEAVHALRKSLELKPQDPSTHSQLLQALSYIQAPQTAAHFAEFRQFSSRFEKTVHPLPPRKSSAIRTESAPRKIRIGYVSSDFRNHSVALFVEPLLQHHDKSRFDIFCYSNLLTEDAVTLKLRNLSNHWRRIEKLPDSAVANLIRQDDIDILIDLNNHTSGNRLTVFALQPAPIQMTMIGLMQTTGLRSIQYRITDAYLDPDETDDAFHSETRIRLNAGPMVFQPPDDAPEVTSLPALQAPPFTFACTNELMKVTHEVIDTWASILLAAPDSHFQFFGRSGNTLRQALEQRGITPTRITEIPRLKMRDFLATHSQFDLALDPFPYNGLTATLLSCWMGVPCITLEGNTPPSRAASAILKRIGLSAFVTFTKADYINKAIAFYQSPNELQSIRNSLRTRIASHFTNSKMYVAELESTFLNLLKKHSVAH